MSQVPELMRSIEKQKQVLIRLVERIVRESGSEHAVGFRADAWLDRWIQRPLLALGGLTPADMLKKRGGLAIVTRILQQAQSGAYA
jgi:uncharacterized protein (DUF2384 family)